MVERVKHRCGGCGIEYVPVFPDDGCAACGAPLEPVAATAVPPLTTDVAPNGFVQWVRAQWMRMHRPEFLEARRQADADAQAAWQRVASAPGLHLTYVAGAGRSATVLQGDQVRASMPSPAFHDRLLCRRRLIHVDDATFTWTTTWRTRRTVADMRTGAVVLTGTGSHIDRKAKTVLDLGGRTVSLPVNGRKHRSAVMVARSDERDLAHFRLARDPTGRTMRDVVEVAVPVIRDMPTTLVFVVVTAPLLYSYFTSSD